MLIARRAQIKGPISSDAVGLLTTAWPIAGPTVPDPADGSYCVPDYVNYNQGRDGRVLSWGNATRDAMTAEWIKRIFETA